MANPPFNVDGVDKEKDAIKKHQDRFPFGLPKPDNANYLWIEMFWSALNETGRAGFVMANSAADARGTELDIRKALIETGTVDCIVSVGPNFFYAVTFRAIVLEIAVWISIASLAIGGIVVSMGEMYILPGSN